MSNGFVGMGDLIRDLRALDSGAVDDAAAKALEQGALEIVMKAKLLSPEKTGRFKRSIHIGGMTHLTPDFRGGSDRGWKYYDLGGRRVGKRQMQLVIGSALAYAPAVEYGGPHNPARRPVGTAVDGGAERITALLRAEMDRLANDLDL